MVATTVTLRVILIAWWPLVWSAAQSTSCQFGQSPSDLCVYLCHCKFGIACDSADGSCRFGCTPVVQESYEYVAPWSGLGCQMGDSLHEKSAINGPEVVMDADLALNGNQDPNGQCAISKSLDGSLAWWQADMGDTYFVTSVTVVSSADASYLSYSRVEVSSSLKEEDFRRCGDVRNFRSPGQDVVQCEPGIQGRYVRITRVSSALYPDELRLCHAYVSAFLVRDCEPCYFGAGCLTECGCMGNACDDVTGECLSMSCSDVTTTTTSTTTSTTATTTTTTSTTSTPTTSTTSTPTTSTTSTPTTSTITSTTSTPTTSTTSTPTTTTTNPTPTTTTTPSTTSTPTTTVTTSTTSTPTTSTTSIPTSSTTTPTPTTTQTTSTTSTPATTTTTIIPTTTTNSSVTATVEPLPNTENLFATVGGLAGAAVLLIVIAIACCLWFRRNRKVASRPSDPRDGLYMGLQNVNGKSRAAKGNTRYVRENISQDAKLHEQVEPFYQSIGARKGKAIYEEIDDVNHKGIRQLQGRSRSRVNDYQNCGGSVYTIDGQAKYSNDYSGPSNGPVSMNRPSTRKHNRPSTCYDDSMGGYSDGYTHVPDLIYNHNFNSNCGHVSKDRSAVSESDRASIYYNPSLGGYSNGSVINYWLPYGTPLFVPPH